MSSKGRTELKICTSAAKCHEEADFHIESCPAPPKSINKTKTRIEFQDQINLNFFWIFLSTFWVSPNVVEGWNFDSVELSTSLTRQNVRTKSEIDFLWRISANIFAIAGSVTCAKHEELSVPSAWVNTISENQVTPLAGSSSVLFFFTIWIAKFVLFRNSIGIRGDRESYRENFREC